MSILMSDALKGKIDVKSLEIAKKELKVETSFYCVFQYENSEYYFPLDKLEYFSKNNYAIKFSTQNADNDSLGKILNFNSDTNIMIYLANSKEDICLQRSSYQKCQIDIQSIERQNLSGYNYIITIIINEM